jgi:4-alpha-glucanotransferase
MRIGVLTDLAVGVHPLGADAWALGGVLAHGVGVGAPPDMYNQLGQNWSQPPWEPCALEEAAYTPFRDVLRATLRHAGALRIDHILGLFRLWWVPDGCTPDDGVYVRYDHEALVGILALEAKRAGAFVIGEDLGTIEPWVDEYLASRGILGTTVLWFEKRGDGSPRPPEDYRPGVLATVTVHDLPPTAAYLAGEHVSLREGLGLLTGPVEEVRAAAERERADIVRMLVEHGFLSPDADIDEILLGLHRALLASPCALIGVAMPDLIGDIRTQNQPGTDTEYPNWKVPLCDGRGTPITLDALFDHPRARALLEVVSAGPMPPTGRADAGAANTT